MPQIKMKGGENVFEVPQDQADKKIASGQFELVGGSNPPVVTPPTPVVPAPVTPTPVTPVDRFNNPNAGGAFNTPEPSLSDQERIRREESDRMRAQINDINARARAAVDKERVAGVDRLGQVRAMGARGGLLGSDFGAAQKSKTMDVNKRAEEAVQAKFDMEMSAVFNKIDDRAQKRIDAQQLKADTNAKDYIEFLKTQKEESRADIATMAKGGITLDELDKADIEELKTQTGYDDFMLEAVFNANKPASKQTDWDKRVIGNTIVWTGIDPVTGQLKTLQKQIDVPEDKLIDGTVTITPDGTMLITPKKFDPSIPFKDQIEIIGEEGQFAKPTEAKEPVVKAVGDSLLQYNPATNKWDTIYTANAGDGTNSSSTNWASLIASGKAELSQVPSEERSGVVIALNAMPPKAEDLTATQNKIDILQGLIDSEGLNSAVGTSWLTRGNKLNWSDKLTGQTQDFIGTVNQYLSEKTLQTLIDAKANGATFGALSEGELKILQAAASKIGTWTQKDSSGNVTGFNISEDKMRQELTKIKKEYEDLLAKNKPAEEVIDKTITDDEMIQLRKDFPDMTDDEIRNAFNEVGSDTKPATVGKVNIPSNIQPNGKKQLASRNNNPGNLRFVGQAGGSQGEGGFAKFDTPEEGFQALVNDLKEKAAPGGRLNPNNTVADLIAIYAPPNENDTEKYIRDLENAGIMRGTKLADVNINLLARAIVKKESGTTIA